MKTLKNTFSKFFFFFTKRKFFCFHDSFVSHISSSSSAEKMQSRYDGTRRVKKMIFQVFFLFLFFHFQTKKLKRNKNVLPSTNSLHGLNFPSFSRFSIFLIRKSAFQSSEARMESDHIHIENSVCVCAYVCVCVRVCVRFGER